MFRRILRSLALIAAFLFSQSGQTALVDRGGGLIYDTDLNITWLQDAAAAGNAAGFQNGSAPWQVARDWVANLAYYDTVRDTTWTDWRLPKLVDLGAPGCTWWWIGTECGFSPTTDSELAHMFYVELGNRPAANPDGSTPAGQRGVDFGLVNHGPFLNLIESPYWTGTEYPQNLSADYAWMFNFTWGEQGAYPQNQFWGVWAVRDGDVGRVPLPSTLLLLGAGVIALVAQGRRAER